MIFLSASSRAADPSMRAHAAAGQDACRATARFQKGITNVTCLHRVSGCTGDRTALVTGRPCRTLHQTISVVGPIGGRHLPMPGKMLQAHHGMLLLDERQEFRHHVLEVLHQLFDAYDLAGVLNANVVAMFAACVVVTSLRSHTRTIWQVCLVSCA